MAYVKRFSSEYLSLNGDDYTLEFWDKNFTGSSTELKLGVGGCEIAYDGKGDEKYTGIIGSKMVIPLVIENAFQENFLTNLREQYEEKDVYAHLYINGPSTHPLWSGFIILDLSSKEDISFPYEISLTAVDGLALLKDHDFVPDETIPPPMLKANTYIPDQYEKTIKWISRALSKCGMATTNEGTSIDYQIKTSVNWYNEKHQNTDQGSDPLNLTRVKSDVWYEMEDPNVDVADDELYTPLNTYEVLESILKVWGCRLIYWKHRFRIIQVGEYTKNDTGTVTAPIDIDSRLYDKDAVYINSYPYLGDAYYTRYDLVLENYLNNYSGIQKLSGGSWDYYPAIKSISGDFLSMSGQNYFAGFIPFNTATYPFQAINNVSSKEIATITDADLLDGFYCQVMVRYVTGGMPFYHDLNWSVRAKASGASTFTHYLHWTSALGLHWADYSTISTTVHHVLQAFAQTIATSLGYQNLEIVTGTKVGDNSFIIPIDSDFTGDWDFEFFSLTSNNESGFVPNAQLGMFSTQSTIGGSFSYNFRTPFAFLPDFSFYEQIIPLTNNYSIFAKVSNGAINSLGQTIYMDNVTTNSMHKEIKDLHFGDAETPDSDSSIQIWDGSSWVFSSFLGEWGVGTLTGDDAISELLLREILSAQNNISYKLSCSTTTAVNGKTDLGRPKFINPVGRMIDSDNKKYVFLRGSFTTGLDQWDAEWFEMTYVQNTSTSTFTDINGNITTAISILDDGNPVPRLGNPNQTFSLPPEFSRNESYTSTSSHITAGAISSIPINEIGTAIFNVGDTIAIEEKLTLVRYEFTISALQGATDTSLSIDTITLTEDINAGSFIVISRVDLIEQYQRKSKGTIAGFDVDATSLEKGGVSIDGFLDSDRMVGASSTTLATSESIKAYVDSESGGISNYKFATSSGTGLTSATDGIANAVVVPFDTSSVDSATTTISLNGSGGIAGISGSEYSFSLDENAGSGVYEIKWNIAVDISVVVNRFLGGVTLETGLAVAATPMTWVEVSPSRSWIYNRGTSGNRYGSTSNSILYNSTIESSKRIFRVVFWKEDGQATGKLITEINGCGVTIKQI